MIVIVTPTLNRIEYLKKTFESVRNQTVEDFTWLVIDDGSSVDMNEWQFLYEDPRVVLVHIPHAGVNGARALGLSLIRAEDAIIVELDDHDLLYHDSLERIISEFDTGADVVYGDHDIIDEYGELRGSSYKPDYEQGLFKTGNFACGIRGYKLAAARKAGGWKEDEWPGGDYALFLRMENMNLKFHRAEGSLGKVRVQGDSVSVKYWPEQIDASRRYREKAIAGVL